MKRRRVMAVTPRWESVEAEGDQIAGKLRRMMKDCTTVHAA